jgi:hypothetical protein
MYQWVAIPFSGLEQKNSRVSIGAKPVGQNTASRTSPHNDVIKFQALVLPVNKFKSQRIRA